MDIKLGSTITYKVETIDGLVKSKRLHSPWSIASFLETTNWQQFAISISLSLPLLNLHNRSCYRKQIPHKTQMKVMTPPQ